MSQDKPEQDIHNDKDNNVVEALRTIVSATKDRDVKSIGIFSNSNSTHPHDTLVHRFLSPLYKVAPSIERLAAREHFGNFVIVRETGEKIWEEMPIYARIGMHLLFLEDKVVELSSIQRLFSEESIRQGKYFDSPGSAHNIPHFIAQYQIDLSELVEPDINKYATFNEFFYRKLRKDARPIDENADVVVSPADCRMIAFENIDLATKYWIKGREFTVENLLQSKELAKKFDGGSIGIFRLAPQDYHRFHSPIDTIIGAETHIPGTYYTVNPMAVNKDLDVFTKNVRTVLLLKPEPPSSSASSEQGEKEVAFIAIGALLVGSIRITAHENQKISKGDELGYFAYGGSTIIVLWQKGEISFDSDLITNSKNQLETLVKIFIFNHVNDSYLDLVNKYGIHIDIGASSRIMLPYRDTSSTENSQNYTISTNLRQIQRNFVEFCRPATAQFNILHRVTAGLSDLHQKLRSQQQQKVKRSQSILQDSRDKSCATIDKTNAASNHSHNDTQKHSRRLDSREGRGTFSQTLCAEDTYFPGRPLVAIKMMATKYNSIGIQECKILRYLNASDVNNSVPVVKIFNTFVFEQHFCLVFEYLKGGMLTTVPKNQPEHTRLHVIRKFACQILSALMYLQKMGVLHADLKPDNILLDSGNSSALKIIDFGNAMNLDDVSIYFKTFEIQNPLYRAPEVLLGIPFGSAIDMWSLGCIICEIWLGRPIFQSSTELLDQSQQQQGMPRKSIIYAIIQILGKFPTSPYSRAKFQMEDILLEGEDDPLFEAKIHAFRKSRLCKVLKTCNVDFINFIDDLFQYDPLKRPSPREVLCHPFLAPLFPFSLFHEESNNSNSNNHQNRRSCQLFFSST
ncbi:7911_t:CDS:10 [Ambispora leptoticha]|uniref:phosphatidylserine decarboxylase n=1 Tax=Ambispora leptoticha TaxID=144679 RepID=A0A9N9D480_9GLOM|nr:7911_t:CDS:10 [Ambispora leptoticha]